MNEPASRNSRPYANYRLICRSRRFRQTPSRARSARRVESLPVSNSGDNSECFSSKGTYGSQPSGVGLRRRDGAVAGLLDWFVRTRADRFLPIWSHSKPPSSPDIPFSGAPAKRVLVPWHRAFKPTSVTIGTGQSTVRMCPSKSTAPVDHGSGFTCSFQWHEHALPKWNASRAGNCGPSSYQGSIDLARSRAASAA